ncbi:MAG: GatB/YqeY domain-containing protein [Gammaproteobacteria bacterium]
MGSTIKQRIDDDVKAAMRARDKARLGTLRQVTAAIKQREIDERVELDDAEVLAVLDKLVKQRKDSEEQFIVGGRQDLADQEAFEREIIQSYLPAPFSADEIAALIDEAVAATGAASVKDMGKVMGTLKPQLQGRADLGEVSKTVRARLNG